MEIQTDPGTMPFIRPRNPAHHWTQSISAKVHRCSVLAWTKRLRRGMGERSESVPRAEVWTFRRLCLIPSSFRPLWPELFVPTHQGYHHDRTPKADDP